MRTPNVQERTSSKDLKMSDKKKKAATFRMIEFAIWDDPRICRLSHVAFRAYIWLRTTRNTAILPGLVFDVHVPNLQFVLNLASAEETEAVLRELEVAQLLIRDLDTGAAYLPGVIRQFPPTTEFHVQGYTKSIERVGRCAFFPLLYEELEEFSDPEKLEHVLETANTQLPEKKWKWPRVSGGTTRGTTGGTTPPESMRVRERESLRVGELESREPEVASDAQGFLPASQKSGLEKKPPKSKRYAVNAIGDQPPRLTAVVREPFDDEGKSTIIESMGNQTKAKGL
jgi:hypothetical protein